MVERAAAPRISEARRRLLRAAGTLTTPLLPDDYLSLLNPAWSTRELSGTIVRLKPETRDATTVVVRPNFPWPGHRPGQYLRIGAELNGIRHWRAYTLTSDPDHPEGLVSITVKHVETGRMSPYFTRRVEPGATVFLGDIEGEFKLPDPLPARSLFISAGSGVTPIWSMLRDLERRDGLTDAVHVHCAREPDQVEHHLFPDMPSSRYKQIAPKVKEVCERYGLPYNTGPFLQQWLMVQRTILRLAFPGGSTRPKAPPYVAPLRYDQPGPVVSSARGPIPAFP